MKLNLIIALLDCLNGNIKSAELYVTNAQKYAKEKLISEESEINIFGFILYVIKNKRMSYEETNAESLIKNNKEYLQTWASYSKIIENYKHTDILYRKKIIKNLLKFFLNFF